jgi:hypothetical protein
MRKEDVSEYMKTREEAFSEGTITSAWIKCGIRPSANGVSGVDAFKAEQFAPSNNTSTKIHLPESFPTEPPSDFEPWPIQDEKLVVETEVRQESDGQQDQQSCRRSRMPRLRRREPKQIDERKPFVTRH